MSNWKLVLTTVLTTIGMVPETAIGQTQQQIDWCNGKDNAAPDLIIAGCTAVIQSGQFRGDALSSAFAQRATAYEWKGTADSALADYDQSLKLNTRNTRALTGRGMLYHRKSDDAHALRDIDAAIEIDPKNATAWAYRGDVLNRRREENEAIESFARAIKLSPNWMWPANDRGELYAERGDYQLALTDFDHVVAVSPTSAMGWNNRCRVNAILGRLDQALKDCDEALKIEPNFTNSMDQSGKVSARQHRAFVLLKLGRYDEAIVDYDLAVQIVSNAESLYGRSLAKQKKGDTAGAQADIAAAKALDPAIEQKFKAFGVQGSAHAADNDGKSKVYLSLARIAVNIPDGQMPHFIRTIRSFAAARNFHLVLGGYPKFSRSVTNLKIRVGRDSYFYGSNFLDANSLN